MSSHTPGPWELYGLSSKQKDGTFIQDVGGDFGPAIRLVHTNTEEACSNARLVAAAPELLRALIGLLDPMLITKEDKLAAREFAIQTIQKAEGESK